MATNIKCFFFVEKKNRNNSIIMNHIYLAEYKKF